MTAPVRSDPATTKASGGLSKALLGLFMRHARVAAIEDVSDRFRLVTLEGPPLKGVSWTPGQKVQIAMGSAFMARTYTPLDWDAAVGSTRILGYAHGDGPGSSWLSGLGVGDECDFLGPRSSLDFSRASATLVAVGDETSIGLAYTLTSTNRLAPANCYFEVGDVGNSQQILARLGLEKATLVEKRDDDAHLGAMQTALDASIAAGASFVLTGKASTIQRLRHDLARKGVPATCIHTKAYWASGKRGLD